jgi:hypothetical protein
VVLPQAIGGAKRRKAALRGQPRAAENDHQSSLHFSTPGIAPRTPFATAILPQANFISSLETADASSPSNEDILFSALARDAR